VRDAGAPSEATWDWREALLGLAILAGAWTVLLSEGLGALHLLSRPWLAVGWAVFFGLAAVLAWRSRGTVAALGPRTLRWNGWPSVWLVIAGVFAAILLVIALASPPNTNDSLQYHMSRVAHWAAQRSLDHFPTPIERQLWMPPFAELAVLNVYVLTAGDRLVNLVQWFSMLLCLFGVSLVAARLGAGRRGQALAALFALTLPMGILQSTSTQNDYVTAVWLLCLAYWTVKAHQQLLTPRDWVAAGLATGLGVLTKGTFYGFALPFLIWLGISTLRRAGWRHAILFALTGVALVGVLNAGAWMRNLRTYGLPLGPADAVAAHGNQTWGWRVVVSNALRGLTLHLATPYGDINGPIADAVTRAHDWLGLDVNDPRTTMGEYRVKRSFHEDYAGNPYHTLLIALSAIALGWNYLRSRAAGAARDAAIRSAIFYGAAVLLSALAFCALYKWQLTGSRLHLALFVIWAPVSGVALEIWAAGRGRLGALLAPAIGLVLIAASLRFLLVNPSRPLLPRAEDGLSLWNTPRDELLFVNSPEVMPGYLPLVETAAGIDCAVFGLKIDSSQPEYPFWALLDAPASGVRLEHIEVNALPGVTPASSPPCAILCTYCTEASLQGMPLLYNIQGTYSLYVPAR